VELSHCKQLDGVPVDKQIDLLHYPFLLKLAFLQNLQIVLSIFSFSGLPLLSPFEPK